MDTLSKIKQEQQDIELMIRLYCKHKEGNKELCPTCTELLAYSRKRLERCPFKETRKTCRLCKKHCYNLKMKEQMKRVMRYAGPRMLFLHPIIALKHLWRERQK